MLVKQTIKEFELNPKRLFLIDAMGAILSAFLLGIVLVRLKSTFGIPPSTLYLLAVIPIFFVFFDLYSYQKKKENLGRFLKGIAIMNLMYCILSIGCTSYHYQEIKLLGWIYMILELIIVFILAIIELIVANRLTRKYQSKAN